MHYEGKFEGNGYTITFEKNRGNGMFVCFDRNAEIKNLTIIEDNLVWGLDEYGVGLVCAVNYGLIQNVTVKGSITATKCYAGGIAGMNRGTLGSRRYLCLQ